MSGRGRWFRVYEDLINDPKFLKLSWSFRGKLVGLWCISSGNAGRLPDVSEISLRLRCSAEEVESLLLKVQEVGLFDSVDNKLQPHNWKSRQYRNDISTERVKRFRKRHETVSRNGHETPQIQTQSVVREIPFRDFPFTTAERVSRNAPEAAASGAPPEGCAPAAAAEAERPVAAPPSEEDRARVAATLENFLKGHVVSNGRDAAGDEPIH